MDPDHQLGDRRIGQRGRHQSIGRRDEFSGGPRITPLGEGWQGIGKKLVNETRHCLGAGGLGATTYPRSHGQSHAQA